MFASLQGSKQPIVTITNTIVKHMNTIVKHMRSVRFSSNRGAIPALKAYYAEDSIVPTFREPCFGRQAVGRDRSICQSSKDSEFFEDSVLGCMVNIFLVIFSS
jgi:hypothetical protein